MAGGDTTSGRLRWVRMAALFALALIGYFLVPVSLDPEIGTIGRAIGAVLAFGALIAGMIYQVRTHLDQSKRRVDGLALAILISLEFFALTFYMINVREPAQFEGLRTRLDALYFAITTLATVGYGDVHPSGQLSRALVAIQMAFNLIFIAAAAGLVSSQLRNRVEQRTEARKSARGES